MQGTLQLSPTRKQRSDPCENLKEHPGGEERWNKGPGAGISNLKGEEQVEARRGRLGSVKWIHSECTRRGAESG